MFEIVIVMAVSTIIMTCLFEIYNQTSRNMNRVQRFVFEDTQVLALKHRFEKDIAGLSAIWFKQAEVADLQAQQEKKEPVKDFKKRSFYFYSANKGDQFDIATFITTNALESYARASNRFVRVVYRIEPDTENKDLFRLMRKEISPATEFIDDKALSSGKFYELVGGIQSIQISYHLVDRVALNKKFQAGKKQEDSQDAGEQEAAPILRLVKQWQPVESIEKPVDKKAEKESNSDEEKKEDLGGAPVPKFIEMKIVFGKTLQQQEQEYTLGFFVPSTVDNMPKSIFAIRSAVKKEGAPVAP